jgi:transcriptional regulator with XRE-family HTH domain
VDALREIRLRKGWSQQNLADESGVGQDTISGIESGRHEPRPSTLRKLAAALGVEVVEFFREPALPKVETLPSPVPPEEDADEERRWQGFFQRAEYWGGPLSWLKRLTEWHHGYMERWQRELGLVEEDHADPYGKYKEMETFRDRFRNAMARNGVDAYRIWVLTEQQAEVSDEVREACWELNVAMIEMSRLVEHARELQEHWYRVTSVAASEAERGWPELEEFLAVAGTEAPRTSEA